MGAFPAGLCHRAAAAAADLRLYANSNVPGDPFVRNGTVYCSVDDTLYGVPLDGSEKKTIPTKEVFYWMLSDENACYTVENNAFTDVARPPVKRVDLQTGAMTSWELPAMNLTAVYSSRGSRLLASRLASPTSDSLCRGGRAV